MRRGARTIKSAERTSTGALVAEGTAVYVTGIHYVDTGSPGTVVLKSGGASGTTLITMDAPGSSEAEHVDIIEPGLHFADGCHVTLTSVSAITIFYYEA